MLTIFVIPCDNPKEGDIEKLKESMRDLDVDVQVLDHRDLNKMDKGTRPWYGYLFSNEWFDEGLRFALPYFLEDQKIDYLVLFKKVIEDRGGVKEPKAFQAPRIFRADVEVMGPGDLNPVNAENLSYLKILDGWILEPDRKIQ
jgi:hypothetical protein